MAATFQYTSPPISDQVDIRNGPKIERHFYTPADLKEMTKTQAGRTSMKR
jgi:hypothetical protein